MNLCVHISDVMAAVSVRLTAPHLIVQVPELLHHVLGDPPPKVGLVMRHAVLGEQADAAHAPLLVSAVLQQPVLLGQVVHRVPVSAMDPSGSELQNRFSCGLEKGAGMGGTF